MKKNFLKKVGMGLLLCSITTVGFADESNSCREKWEGIMKSRKWVGGGSAAGAVGALALGAATSGIGLILLGPPVVSAAYSAKTYKHAARGLLILKELDFYTEQDYEEYGPARYPKLTKFYNKHFKDAGSDLTLDEVVEMIRKGNETKYICETKDNIWVRKAMAAKMSAGTKVFNSLARDYQKKHQSNTKTESLAIQTKQVMTINARKKRMTEISNIVRKKEAALANQGNPFAQGVSVVKEKVEQFNNVAKYSKYL